jgi:hypothetical protein
MGVVGTRTWLKRAEAYTFLATVAARLVAAIGGVVFLSWLTVANSHEFATQISLILSWIGLTSFAISAGLPSMSLRLISRLPTRWKAAAMLQVYCVALLLSAVGGFVAAFTIGKWVLKSYGLDFISIALLGGTIGLAATRGIANDIMRGAGERYPIAWFEFGQVLTIALVLMLLWERTSRINVPSAIGALFLASLVIFGLQNVVMVRRVRLWSRQSTKEAPSFFRIARRYWLSIGVAAFFVGLMGSASRDIYILLYSGQAVPGSVAPLSLALRIWEGLALPIVAAHSDLSAAIVGRRADRRREALHSLQLRTRVIVALTWFVVAALAAAAIAPASWLGIAHRLPLTLILIAAASRAVTGLLGMPSILLMLFGGVRRLLLVAAVQFVIVMGAVTIAGGEIPVAGVLFLWCSAFGVRTVWEYKFLNRNYNLNTACFGDIQ